MRISVIIHSKTNALKYTHKQGRILWEINQCHSVTSMENHEFYLDLPGLELAFHLDQILSHNILELGQSRVNFFPLHASTTYVWNVICHILFGSYMQLSKSAYSQL